jgi:hypothetical protein
MLLRPLKPTTILVLAAGLTGLEMLPVFAILQSDTRTPYGLAIVFIFGATGGAIAVAPIAAAEALRERFKRPISMCTVARSYWYVSLVMMTAIGYIAASWRHQTFDRVSVVAFAVIYLGGAFKLFVASIVEPVTAHRRRWWQMVPDPID